MAAQNSNSTLLLPSTTHVINLADSHDRATFTVASQMKEEPMDVDDRYSSSLDVTFSYFLLFCCFRINITVAVVLATNTIGELWTVLIVSRAL